MTARWISQLLAFGLYLSWRYPFFLFAIRRMIALNQSNRPQGIKLFSWLYFLCGLPNAPLLTLGHLVSFWLLAGLLTQKEMQVDPWANDFEG